MNLMWLKAKVDSYNEADGDLNEKDGYNCPKCKNKGFIAELVNENGSYKEFVKECDCMKIRRNIDRINDSGVSKDMFEKYTFQNFKVTEEWQKQVCSVFKQYILDFKNDKRYWLIYGGISGAGKTHLCSALFKQLIMSGLSGYYVKWVDTINELVRLKRSFNKDEQRKYNELTTRLQNYDVLYIDDLFKFSNTRDSEMLMELMKIIEARKDDLSKITIISSEYEFEEIDAIDKALAGRIFERAKNGAYVINCGKDAERNYRYKLGE